ncbi:DUF488 domain-containing protein [Halobacillus halophilus]|uniref:DUF488 domain-containing protein n=1 Tax=Halobacillus halophilus TaxID=1570 RepID=UPI001CD5487E|nr:DUF488 family protein [Halobacillus halophilus]MCA1011921.1 DUF488 family protein [Halobacillus halophilus]
MSIILRRIYDENITIGGHRVLTDRIWPRGISKEDAEIDEWLKSIAPSPELRKWFNHDPAKFDTFTEAYRKEIENNAEAQSKIKELKAIAKDKRLILLFGAKDSKHNHAVVLKEILEDE